MRNETKKGFSKVTMIIILILIALSSNLLISEIVSGSNFNKTIIKSLDEKKLTVTKLATAAMASSTALSLIPGNAAMPIANQMADLSKYFIIVLSAILLEKMLVGVIGYISFSYIIPIACGLGILYLFTKLEILRNLSIKLSIFGIIIFLAIPISIKASDLIYLSHESSLEQTIEEVEENKEYIEQNRDNFSQDEKNLVDKMEDYLSNISSRIGGKVSQIIEKGEDTLSTFLDAIAVLIVTSCIVPLIIILIFLWMIKILFNFDTR